MLASVKVRKAKVCRVASCGTEFVPQRLGQAVCSPACAIKDAPVNRDKAHKALAEIGRKEIKVRKEKLKSRGEFVQDAEKAVRDYRRTYELSVGSGCISCGKGQAEIQAAQGWKTGGCFDGGHFLGKGARPELRMVPENIWLQCKGCNAGSFKYARKGLTVSQGFRAGLIDRIGLEAVETLEADHEPRKHTIDDLKAIAADYRAKTRELQRAQA
ncbi:recombination protein NinG [Pseudomonas sp. 10B1]|uniref:recombination protein NinG n=1 Tax=Pseudomonas sp. 10B1 TaxID=3048573 RepID=UPI002B23587A|nr:recombination protein NinG [Pseudomonas sp. 10B1]MEB0311526.1 recombination protein NinG [Pseudomonas sp. 10B1]